MLSYYLHNCYCCCCGVLINNVVVVVVVVVWSFLIPVDVFSVGGGGANMDTPRRTEFTKI